MKNSANTLKAKEHRENYQLASECVGEGVKLLRAGKLKRAEEMVRRGKDLFEQIGEVQKTASSLNVLSIIFDELGNDALCMTSMLEAIDLALSIEAYDMVSKVYNNLGSKFMYLKSNERALKYCKMALNYFDKSIENGTASDLDIQAYALILNLNIAMIYCNMGDNEKARQYYEVAKEKSSHPYCESVLFSFQCFEGYILWKLGEKEVAASLVDTTIESIKNCEYSTDYLESVIELIEFLKEMKAYDKWKSVLEIIENRMQEDISIYDKISMLELWLEYYSAIEDEEKYNETCSQYYKLYQEKEFHEYEKRADMLASIIERRETEKEREETDKIVYLDPLTGIGNRNRLLSDSEKLIVESSENKSAITIGLVDIDFFKECNDTYGHIVGDDCLKKVAAVLKEAVADHGNVYRYGGDEFLILVTGMEEKDVPDLGKAIKDKLDEIKIANERSQIVPYITVSQGYTQVYACQNDTIEKLINSADNVLYAVKRSGRNNYKYSKYLEIVRGALG